ncbi:flavodoxin family protein [Xanthomonas campestris]|uniref:flavodoxin family protein n=1 Tax=Xanthomonas campestris TaxID=339 RepID=UPI00101AE385|nr:flavodoxin family protein [Xanthomonas campestris]MCD0255907.1 flavodoxin family protein [Xanthomonas campestris pv. campestris]MEB1303432.1 flavodoxin family protein [Xanthomonas campestris pv. campestris]MEB1308209.1 flavodoxin family protein [Xanthomonas campestris pv. campestris]MEB1333285.1 flavodoxin family protein [Xanthomonas campestris pv. campestris]MEB1902105.1 flavodoxin family protein [Xanthomonas campestris pv. campestris]
MTKIAIVYFSGYGHTVKQAEAVHAGAASVGEATLYRIDQDGNLPDEAWEAIGAADAIIYGSPTYMGGPAWQFKKFADVNSKPWFTQAWKDKVAAGFTNSASVNGDKYATIQYFWTLSQQHGQVWVGTGLPPSNTKAHGPQDINWTAGWGGALAISPSDASPEEAPRSGDLETARLLGKRVAEIAAKLKG